MISDNKHKAGSEGVTAGREKLVTLLVLLTVPIPADNEMQRRWAHS